MIFLETPRLVLRNVEEQDEAVMFDYRNHPLCARYQRGQKRARHQIHELIGRRREDVLSCQANCMIAVANRTTGEMVGEIVVMPTDKTFSLGYTMSYRHHRKGYAFEALSALIGHLHHQHPAWEFISFVHPDNAASMGLLKKLGYRDLGYIAGMESQVFGKWVHPETVEEVAQAAKKK